MIQKVLLVSIVLVSGSFAAPCPSCPTQPFYLPESAGRDIPEQTLTDQARTRYKQAGIIEKLSPFKPRGQLDKHKDYICDEQKLYNVMRVRRGKPALPPLLPPYSTRSSRGPVG